MSTREARQSVKESLSVRATPEGSLGAGSSLSVPAPPPLGSLLVFALHCTCHELKKRIAELSVEAHEHEQPALAGATRLCLEHAVDWPVGGEIDIMEMFNGDGLAWATCK